MKKSLFIVASAALVLASCNNDVTLDENVALEGSNAQKEIAFSPYAQGPKRAISNTNHGIIAGPTFETSWGMTVSAVDVTKSAASFFEATNFVYDATPALWRGETPRYWPLSPVQVNFLAIAHANANNSTGVNWTANNTSHQVVVDMSDNYAIGSAQRDFMYAIGSGQVTLNGTTLSFPAKIDMNFKHTQAYLIFKVKAANEASKAIHVTNIEVKGARTAGKATIARHDPDNYNDDAVDLLWEAPTSGGTAYPASGDGTAYNSVTATQAAIDEALTLVSEERGHLLVVPNMSGTFDGSDESVYDNGFTSFKISYTFEGNNYTYEYAPASTVLMAGKKYIYDITFNLHEIYVAPTVETWTDGGTTAVEIPSIAYNESGANVHIGANAGTYTFTIMGVPAGTTYGVVEADALGDTDFITSVNQTNTATASAAGIMTITVETIAGDDDSHRDIVIQLGGVNKMKITLTKKTSI